ncbi:MAG: isoaspartyl peptidase/L-asparaginase [Bacteroidales bacterium]
MKLRNILYYVPLLILASCSGKSNSDQIRQAETREKADWSIVVHGGAGVITRDKMTPALDSQYRAALVFAIKTGSEVLDKGGSALDAVESAIRTMEDNPLFNAGKGAVFNSEGRNELDAAIMDGSNLSAGAVACVTDIKNPISAARAVMTRSEHVLLSGQGASKFAKEQGLEIVDPSYFYTDRRYNELQETLKKEKNGTVGCCALDRNGNLAAGTSTGGRTNKKYNRIGDTPVIGAGTYANNATCAVSATGHGEYFIRYTVAHDISALMEYKGMTVNEASDLVVNKKLVSAGGAGGVICIDRYGDIAFPFNTEGMFRAFASSSGSHGVYIYKDEK